MPMEIEIGNLDWKATKWDLERCIASILHESPEFVDANAGERLINFAVHLSQGHDIASHNGEGRIVLADSRIAQKLLAAHRARPLTVNGRRLSLRQSNRLAGRYEVARLEKTPYINVDIRQRKEVTTAGLDKVFYLELIELGAFYYSYGEQLRPFSPEWSVNSGEDRMGTLQLDYDQKMVRIMLGNPAIDEESQNIGVPFAEIHQITIGHDFGKPSVCFEVLSAPTFYMEYFNRTLTGNKYEDSRKYRFRLGSLDDAHARVAPYAPHVRVVMHKHSDLYEFAELCKCTGLRQPIEASIKATREGFFSERTLRDVHLLLAKLPWAVAFHVETLLRGGLVNTQELLDTLLEPIRNLCARSCNATDTMRHFVQVMRQRKLDEGILGRFKDTCAKHEVDGSPKRLSHNQFLCYSVVVTPTRLLPEGPYVIQSNRVLREYRDYKDHFIRVELRDEDGLPYRPQQDINSEFLMNRRFLDLLVNGFTFGGRHFKFLGWSSSSLSTHCFVFVHPGQHAFLDPNAIRKGLGSFIEDRSMQVLRQPAKYAARLGLSFTATDAVGVKIQYGEFERIPDLGCEEYPHTDGMGTIAPEVMEELCKRFYEQRGGAWQGQVVETSVAQIRFAGCKGVVAVDRQMPKGLKMRLYESMIKYDLPKENESKDYEIEIVRLFDAPNQCYLNRPLITVLEDRGVAAKNFIKLQQSAIAAVHQASDTIAGCRQLFKANALGRTYGLAFILQCLESIGLGMNFESSMYKLESFFIHRLVHYAKLAVLRDMRRRARIPVPGSWHLVATADQGPAYEKDGYGNVFKLEEGEIYACVQRSADEQPIYIEGNVTLARSPVVDTGEIVRVYAIGKPPDDKVCFFRGFKNVVVLPADGNDRSLASKLGGGDVDGDMVSIITEGTLLHTSVDDPAEYPKILPYEVDHDCTAEDICRFAVDYMQYDVLGLLADRHLLIADQSKDGTRDPACKEIARLHGQAVDYAKHGNPVDIGNLPSTLIRGYKPDWKRADDADPRDTDYYESDRALGKLYRNITPSLPADLPPRAPFEARSGPLSDTISEALKPYIVRQLGAQAAHTPNADVRDLESLFRHYADELGIMRSLHVLKTAPGSVLLEEEVVLGTILASCSQNKHRNERAFRMREDASVLVESIRAELYKRGREERSLEERRAGLAKAWRCWDFATRQRGVSGSRSFALIALRAVLEALADLGEISVKGENEFDESVEAS